MTSYNLLALIERPLVKRVSHSVATGLVGQVALVASGVILARSLGVDDRGRLAVLVLTAAVVSQVGTLGIPTALTYATAHGDLVGRAVLWRIKWIIGLQLAIGAAIEVGILFAITRGWHGPWVAPTLAAIALTLLGMLQQYGLAALQGARRFRAFNVCRTLPVAGFSALAVAAVIFTHIDLRLAILLLAFSTGVATAATMGTVLAGPAVSNREAEAPAPRSLLRFGFRALLTSSSPLETFRVDQAVVGLFLSARALGLYVVAAAFTNVPRFVAQSVGMVAYPEVAVAQTSRDARQRVSVFLMLGTALVLLVAVPLELGAGWLIPLFFGPDFGGATSACRLLIAAGALIGVRRVLTDCLNGLGRPQLGSYAEFVSWIALLLTLPIGAVVAGLPGVSAALLVSAGASLIFLAVAGLGHRPRAAQTRRVTSIALSLGRCVLILGLIVGVGAAIPFVSSKSVLLVGIGLTLIGALVVRRARMGPLDLFDPLSLFVIAWAIMFIARPAVMAAYGDFTLLHYDARSGFNKMLVLALLGAVGFVGGYFSRFPVRWASRRRSLPDISSHSIAIPYAITLICGAFVLFGIFLSKNGGAGALTTLVAGRSQALADLWQNSSAYLSGALMLTFPAALLLVDVGLRRRDRFLIGGGILALLPAIAPGVVTGTRSLFLPIIAALWMLPYLRRGTRPRPKAVIVVAFLAFTVGITFVGATRDIPERQHGLMGPLRSSVLRPHEGARRLIETGDTAMAPLLSIMISNVPHTYPYMDGAATGEFLVHWVPRALWPGKPRQGDEVLTRKLFWDTGISTAPMQYSPLANFYLDLGLVGGLLGMAFIGMLARAHYEYFQRHFRKSSVQLFYAATLPFWIDLLRGNLTETTARLAFVVPPLILGMYLARGHSARQKRIGELAATGRGA